MLLGGKYIMHRCGGWFRPFASFSVKTAVLPLKNSGFRTSTVFARINIVTLLDRYRTVKYPSHEPRTSPTHRVT